MNNSPLDNEPRPTPPGPASGQPIVRVAFTLTPPRYTFIIIGITVLFYLLQIASVAFLGYVTGGIDILELFGARINSLVEQGQVWRLITPILLHGSVTHILFNMYSLFSLGRQLEGFYGHKRFVILYLLAGFAGNAFSFLIGPQDDLSIGASTSIFGLVAAEGVFLFQNRRILGERSRSALREIGIVVLLNLIVLGSLPGIDNWGHIGGLFGGLIFGWLAGPLWTLDGIQPDIKIVDTRESRDIIIGAATVIVFFGLLVLSRILFR